MSGLSYLIIIIEESGAVIKVVISDRWEVKCFFATESRAGMGTSKLGFPPDACAFAAVVCVSGSVHFVSSSTHLLQQGHSTVQGNPAALNL